MHVHHGDRLPRLRTIRGRSGFRGAGSYDEADIVETLRRCAQLRECLMPHTGDQSNVVGWRTAPFKRRLLVRGPSLACPRGRAGPGSLQDVKSH